MAISLSAYFTFVPSFKFRFVVVSNISFDEKCITCSQPHV